MAKAFDLVNGIAGLKAGVNEREPSE